MDPFTLFVISTVLSTGASTYSAKLANDAANRTTSATLEALRRQSESDFKGQQIIDETIDKFDPNQRKIDLAEKTAEGTSSFAEALERDRNVTKGQTQGRLSKDFTEGRANSEIELYSEGLKRAKNAGALSANSRVAQDQNSTLAKSAMDLSGVRGEAAGKRGVDKIRIEEAGRINDGAKLFSNILKGLATGARIASLHEALNGPIGLPPTPEAPRPLQELSRIKPNPNIQPRAIARFPG